MLSNTSKIFFLELKFLAMAVDSSRLRQLVRILLIVALDFNDPPASFKNVNKIDWKFI